MLANRRYGKFTIGQLSACQGRDGQLDDLRRPTQSARIEQGGMDGRLRENDNIMQRRLGTGKRAEQDAIQAQPAMKEPHAMCGI